MAISEFQLITRYLTGLGAHRDDVILGIGDDAALLSPPSGQLLAVSTDTLVSGVHFPQDAPPESIGHKALAVNLSDLAAMGAEPAWATVALTLPEAGEEWLRAFSRGFSELARHHGVALVGGDLCRGPLSMTVHVSGFVPHDKALRRTGARPGDAILVSGTLGDAALGLQRWQKQGASGDADHDHVVGRLHRPTPRCGLGLALRDCGATAAIDISDGLAADLGHILRAGNVGAVVRLDQLPLSQSALRLAGADLAGLALRGGDDYELCFTVPESRLHELDAISRRAAVQVTQIGTVESGDGFRVLDAQGAAVALDDTGYRHFSG